MKIKGLKDIKTLRDFSRPRPTPREQTTEHSTIRIGALSTRPNKYPLKTWVFTREPKFERFQKSLLVDKVQEPYVNVFEEMESVVVIADLPGVMEENITLETINDILVIEALADTVSGKRRYSREVLIPFEIDPHRMDLIFKNGMLEAILYRLKKKNKRRKTTNDQKS